jgi:methionine sulfoxide reductase heme-binding subunit
VTAARCVGDSCAVRTRNAAYDEHANRMLKRSPGRPLSSMNTVPLARKSYWTRRAGRHVVLAICAAAIIWLAYAATPPPDVRHRLCMGTAYAGLVFLVASLSLGPWNVLRRRPNPISFDLRRDIGIWTAVLALLHTSVGLTVHLRGRMWMYFFKQLHPLKLQNTQFGLANYFGLAAALLFLMLVVISNDFSLRTLRTSTWKSLQRWAYVAAVLTVLHGVLFQLVEKRHTSCVFIFSVLILAAVGVQAAGFLKMKWNSPHRA